MPEAQDIKTFVESYEDANGNNPISAAFALWTIAKSAPLQFIKAGIVAWLYLGTTITISWLVGLPWVYMLVIQVISGFIFLFLGFFAAVKYLSSIVIDAVAELIGGVLAPIDDMYEVYHDEGNKELGRFQFARKVMQEVIFPRLSDILRFVPMKKRLSKTIRLFIDQASKENAKEISYEEITNSSVKTMMARVHRAARTTRSVVSKPYQFFALLYILIWVGMVIWYLTQHYTLDM